MNRTALCLVAAVVLLPGCYGQRLANLEVRTQRIEDQVNALSRRNAELATTVETVRRLVEEETQLARSGRAGSEDRLKEIQRLLNQLASRVDENREQYSELKDAVRYGGRTPPPVRPDSSAAPAGNVTPRTLYDAAYQDLTRGNYGLALLGFQEMLSKFPDSELADNAQYWIGETYYAQKDYKTALQEFEKAVATYPKGDKLPAALLKVGFCQSEAGAKDAARTTFEKLVQRFPETEEARLAQSKLRDL